MERFFDVLLQVWREVGRHTAISDSAAIVASLLADRIPLQALIVKRFDLPNEALETVGTGPDGFGVPEMEHRTKLSSHDLKELLGWCSSGQVISNRHTYDSFSAITELFFIDPSKEMLSGPLVGPEGPIGILHAVSLDHTLFDPVHHQLFCSLLEPFAVALTNDRRLEEMAALREAAEADRRSLLARLGRHDMSERIVGSEQGLKLIMERVKIVAVSDVPVLILGETGTGKEIIARAIHNRSHQASGPFIRVNCGAIPPELIDSQLFGHERGSFTGATAAHQGWFERADHGTLFLDEIGELSSAAQVRLLRVLQDGLVERVGAKRPLSVSVRVISATHRNLQEMVKMGTFREDLWYRLAVFPLELPALRDRPQDIPELAGHFLEKAMVRFGLPPVHLNQHSINALLSYHWPGNIRELAAVIDRAALISTGNMLDIEKALGNVVQRDDSVLQRSTDVTASALLRPVSAVSTPVVQADYPSGTHVSNQVVVNTLDVAMRQVIENALHSTHGRIDGPFGAAKKLGINPHTLRSRMKKMGICWKSFRS